MYYIMIQVNYLVNSKLTFKLQYYSRLMAGSSWVFDIYLPSELLYFSCHTSKSLYVVTTFLEEVTTMTGFPHLVDWLSLIY